jgi:hypothetical protein
MKTLLLLFLRLAALAADPALIIYNQNFAVVRERIEEKKITYLVHYSW